MEAIEFYHLEEIHPSITKLIPNERSASGQQSHTIQRFRDALTEGGWNVDEAGSPKASVVVGLNVFNMPVRSPDPPGGDDDKEDGAVICAGPPAIIVTSPEEGVVKVWGYDPGKFKEPPCSSFGYGFTQGHTYDIFKNALSGALGMGIWEELFLGDGGVQLKFVSPFSGPDPNGTKVGGWVNGTVWYGGWRMTSQTYRGWLMAVSAMEGPGFGGGAWGAWELVTRLHRGVFDLVGTSPRTFSLALSGRFGGGATPPPPYSYSSIGVAPPAEDNPNANTGDWSWYRIAVCPYQFAIWFEGSDDTPLQQGASPKSLFLSMPWAPDEFTGHDVFAFGANSILACFRNQMEWPAATQFDGKDWIETGVAIPCMRVRNEGTVNSADRVTNTQGAVLMENAYVCSQKNDTGYIGNHRICGKLWNCTVLDQAYPASTITADMQGGTWLHVGSHAWAADYSALPGRGVLYGAEAASVWWKVDNVSAPE